MDVTAVAIAMFFHLALGYEQQPLLLTPLIRQGKLTDIHELSKVKDAGGVIPTSYAGFITVEEEAGNHLFFWFVPSLNQDPEAPLLFWLNGGPGVTSMFGLLYDNGPIRLKQDGINGAVGYERWNKSWAEKFCMLYVDNPVGVGYSYSDRGEAGYRTNREEYTRDLYEFIQQFYVAFPEFLQRQLYIGGTSYAGKYVTSFAHLLHTKFSSGQTTLPLTGLFLGSPYFDPLSQNMAYLDFFYSKGAVSRKQVSVYKKELVTTLAAYVKGELDKFSITEIMESIRPTFGCPDVGNYLSDVYPPFDAVQQVMSSDSVQRAVHAGGRSFNATNMRVYDLLAKDILTSVKPQLAELMDHYKILIYNGDFDGIVGSQVVEAALMSIPWSHQAEYNDAIRHIWTDRQWQQRGFYTKIDNLCRVVIRGAGHSAGHNQPEATLDMMQQFIFSGCIVKNGS